MGSTASSVGGGLLTRSRMSSNPTSSSRAPNLSGQDWYLPVRAAPKASFRTRLAPRSDPFSGLQHARSRALSVVAGQHLLIVGSGFGTQSATLGIPRLDREAELSGPRPEIPVSELTADRLDRLLAIIDHWITDVRAHSAEPETTTNLR